MNYSDLTAQCRNKFKGYTLNQCHFALRDIHTTIALHEGDLNHPYIQKLWAELDAVRDRRDALCKGDREAVASRRSPSVCGET